ncbi:MAG: gliding motility-associated C-terminal domain-containing protein [Cryomorphaceae bacterium]|nr:gliding motility-associated C-terminal domain-containing protein [Flavobacteriales bacterium]
MKLLQTILFTLAFLLSFNVLSNHIAGGDFSVRHVEGNTFEATLILYRDCDGNLVVDNAITIAVFDALTDEALTNLTFTMGNPTSEIIPLANSCYDTGLCVESQTYIQTITLPDNPNGYYLSWERCCRNELALNVEAASQSMVFTVQVADPALQNSSPEFLPYPSDAFLCINGEAEINFGATDMDGDSLVYSIIAPLRGNFTGPGVPPPIYPPGSGPRPYPGLNYTAEYNLEDPVGGDIPLTLDPATGIAVAQPLNTGFFSLSVKVEEFRDGVKIGEVIREVQVAALICEIDLPSEIFTPIGDTIFDVLANSSWCIEIEVTDPNVGDSLFVQASGELFDGTVQPQAVFADVETISTVIQDLCWQPLCANLRDEPYVVTLTAFSKGCAEEVFFTEQDIYINVILEEDEPTALAEPVVDGSPGVFIDLYNPSTHCFEFVFEDPNAADSIFVTPSSKIFEFDNAFALTPDNDQGTLTLPFCWEVICAQVRDEPYIVEFEVLTTNCEVKESTFFSVPIYVIVPENEPTLIPEPADSYTFEFYAQPEFCIPVTAVDGNFFDTLQVSARSELFELSANPASFDPLNGLSLLQDTLCWRPRCSDVRDEPYLVEFMVTAQSCKTTDTTFKTIEINLELPVDQPATLTILPDGDAIEHTVGSDPINFTVQAIDENVTDTIILSGSWPDIPGPQGLPQFEETGGAVQVISNFLWNPTCDQISEDPYVLTFEVNSKSCQKDVSEFIDIEIAVVTPTRGDIEPIANIFTPNGDGRNDRWLIQDEDDVCLLSFNAVVFDRWGREVYSSDDPTFEWDGLVQDGSEAADGNYFRVIEYIYKGVKKSYSGDVVIVGSNPPRARR